MNEFAWRRQLRGLRQPTTPRRDLWAGIEAALEPHDAETPTVAAPRRAWPAWFAAAAITAAFLLAGGAGLRLGDPAGAQAMVQANAPWRPADPRLSGAAIELDAARMELEQAMRQAPDSPVLQRLLARTEQQQHLLHQLTREAG